MESIHVGSTSHSHATLKTKMVWSSALCAVVASVIAATGSLVLAATVLAVFILTMLGIHNFRGLLVSGAVLLTILFLVNGAFPQLEMLLFHGNVPIPSIVLKGLLVVVVVLAFLIRRRFAVSRSFAFWWWIFAMYLLLDGLLLVNHYHYTVGYVGFSYNTYYYYLLILPGIYILEGYVKQKNIATIIVTLVIPLGILGLSQYLTNTPIVKTGSPGDYFHVYAYTYYNHTRAFSLFSSALDFGYFVALALGVVFFLIRGQRVITLWYFALLLFCLAVGYTTLTRNIYLTMAGTLITAILLRVFKGTGGIRYIPLVYGALGFLILDIGPLLASLWDHSLLANDQSLLARILEWNKYLGVLIESPSTLLFGTGFLQNDRLDVSQNVMIDNSFLAISLQIGIIGLFLWGMLMWNLWKYLLHLAQRNPSPLVLGLLSFWSTWVMSGMFNISTIIYSLVFLLVVLSGSDRNRVTTSKYRGGIGDTNLY